MRRRGVAIAFLGTLAVALVACSFGVETRVTGSLVERIAFEFFYEGKPVDQLHIHHLEVTEIFPDHEEPIWTVQGNVQRDRLWYGLEPVGMTGKPPSRGLRPGGTYRVRVDASLLQLTWSGAGNSSAVFRIRDEGRPEPASAPAVLPRRCGLAPLSSPDAGPTAEPGWPGTLCP